MQTLGDRDGCGKDAVRRMRQGCEDAALCARKHNNDRRSEDFQGEVMLEGSVSLTEEAAPEASQYHLHEQIGEGSCEWLPPERSTIHHTTRSIH